jgi:hypothetical protein
MSTVEKKGRVQRFVEAVRGAQIAKSVKREGPTISETAVIPLADVMKLYERDPTCKSSVDLLAASAVGMGFYTTCAKEQEKAKDVVDAFCEKLNLDFLLNDMARNLIGCGNDFWLKLLPEKLDDLRRMPLDAVDKIEHENLENLKISRAISGYKLVSAYGGKTLSPEALIHWRINCTNSQGFGLGILQVLLHTLTISGDKRPAFAWMKAKIERIMPKIFEKYAGPDVLVNLPKAKSPTIETFQKAIKERNEEGTWLFHNGESMTCAPVSIDPRARFEYYLDHMVNQFYLGCETPLPRLFSTPGFTEASANAAVELQDMLVKPVQRYIKRQVEADVFWPALQAAGFEPKAIQEAGVRLNWGSPETPEVLPADMIRAAELNLIRADEFRKNASKLFGWELWEEEPEPGQDPSSASKGAVKT